MTHAARGARGQKIAFSLCLLTIVGGLAWIQFGRLAVRRPAVTTPTITQLPPPAGMPVIPFRLGSAELHRRLLELTDHKLATYPAVTSRRARPGRLCSTPLFSVFEPTAAQVRTVARHYDLVVLFATRAHLVPVMREENPDLRVFLYFDTALTEGADRLDAGSVDGQNTQLLLAARIHWMLMDADGRPLRSFQASRPYWPDPGNADWRKFFAEKLNRVIADTGSVWDGVVLDQVFARPTSYAERAGTREQTAYPDLESYQAALLGFLAATQAVVDLPIIANVTDTEVAADPRFFERLLSAGDGFASDSFVFTNARVPSLVNADETAALLRVVANAPSEKLILLTSPAADMAGDVDRTLYAYFTYLLVADPARPIYWTWAEGLAAIPHYWYRELDLELGPALAPLRTADGLWSRELRHATVVVNPTDDLRPFTYSGSRTDVNGRPLVSPLSVPPRSGMLLRR